MSRSCVMSLVSANLRRGSLFLCFPKSKPWSTRLTATANSVSCTSKPVRGSMSLTYSLTRFDIVSETGPPEIQFPGGSPSEEELPSRPGGRPGLAPLEVPDLPNIPEIIPFESPPEVPSDPPPLGPPQTPGPDFPVPPSPSPPMPDTPSWEPPSPPEITPPGIDPPMPPGIDLPPPMEPTLV